MAFFLGTMSRINSTPSVPIIRLAKKDPTTATVSSLCRWDISSFKARYPELTRSNILVNNLVSVNSSGSRVEITKNSSFSYSGSYSRTQTLTETTLIEYATTKGTLKGNTYTNPVAMQPYIFLGNIEDSAAIDLGVFTSRTGTNSIEIEQYYPDYTSLNLSNFIVQPINNTSSSSGSTRATSAMSLYVQSTYTHATFYNGKLSVNCSHGIGYGQKYMDCHVYLIPDEIITEDYS